MEEAVHSIKRMILGAFLALVGIVALMLIFGFLVPWQMAQIHDYGTPPGLFLTAVFQPQVFAPLVAAVILSWYGIWMMRQEYRRERETDKEP